MPQHLMTIATAHYVLRLDEDVNALSQRLAAAARTGDIVHIVTAQQQTLHILVTPGVPITIESADTDTQTGTAQPITSDELWHTTDLDLY